MATNAQYALMAGAAYRSTVARINQFPAPDGWTLVNAHPQDNATGFEAYAFGNAATLADSTEIVIAYAGTNSNSLIDPDWATKEALIYSAIAGVQHRGAP
jgi:hypothetical protein